MKNSIAGAARRVSTFVPWGVCLVLVAGCSADVGLSDLGKPYLTGVIASRASASVFVDGSGGLTTPESCGSKGQFNIVGETRVFRGTTAVAAAQLTVRLKVSVWTTGIVIATCPIQANAMRIVIEGS